VQAGMLKSFSMQSGSLEIETNEIDVEFHETTYRLGPFSVYDYDGEGLLCPALTGTLS